MPNLPSFLRDFAALVSCLIKAPREPLNLKLEAGGARVVLRAPFGEYAVRASMQDHERAYEINIPLDLRSAPVEVTWTPAGADSCTRRLSPSEFQSLQVPPEFRELHARLVEHLRPALPASLRAKLGLAKKAERTKAWADAPFQPVLLEQADSPALEFSGRALAQVTLPITPLSHFLLEVFEGHDGKIVIARSSLRLSSGSRERTEARVFNTPAEAMGLIGASGVALQLYAALGWDAGARRA